LVGEVTGVLATRGNLVFAGLASGQLAALDARDGKILWSFRAGGPIAAAPVTYSAGGKQFIAITAGNMLYAFSLSG
jgi:outer membrane protein assembly factor BamB